MTHASSDAAEACVDKDRERVAARPKSSDRDNRQRGDASSAHSQLLPEEAVRLGELDYTLLRLRYKVKDACNIWRFVAGLFVAIPAVWFIIALGMGMEEQRVIGLLMIGCGAIVAFMAIGVMTAVEESGRKWIVEFAALKNQIASNCFTEREALRRFDDICNRIRSTRWRKCLGSL